MQQKCQEYRTLIYYKYNFIIIGDKTSVCWNYYLIVKFIGLYKVLLWVIFGKKKQHQDMKSVIIKIWIGFFQGYH